MSFLSVQLLEPNNGLNVLKNALELFFKSFDFLYQYCLIAILLCLVASFLALRRNSQFSGVLFCKYLSFALRLAPIALFQ